MAVTENGLIIERFPEVLNNIEANQREKIDPDIINRDDQVLSEINVILSEQIVKANEFIEAVRDCWDIAKAEGIALDNLLALKKVFRIPASKSFTNSQVVAGINGAVVPVGRRVKSTTTNNEYVFTSSVTVSLSSCNKAELSIVAANNTTYALSVFGVSYSYTSDADATATEIYEGIQSLFTATPIAGVTLTSSLAGKIVIDAGSTFIPVVVNANIVVDKVFSRGRVEALVTGAQLEPANSLTQMTLPVTGLLSTYNEDALVVGRNVESDEEYRLRGIQTLSSAGTGTVPVIEASLINNVAGVTIASVIENNTAFQADELPPHSYKVVINGGDDEAIARDIWRTKPAGIETVGDEEVSFTDNRNVIRTVKFQRPTPIILAIKVSYTLYDEEGFPPFGVSAIRNQVVAYVNSLGVDKDVIPKRIASLAYPPTIEGVDDIVVEIQVIAESGDVPVELDWQETRLPIENDEYATVAPVDVYVLEVV